MRRGDRVRTLNRYRLPSIPRTLIRKGIGAVRELPILNELADERFGKDPSFAYRAAHAYPGQGIFRMPDGNKNGSDDLGMNRLRRRTCARAAPPV